MDSVFNVPPQLRVEATRSFQVMAVSLPFITVAAGMRGLLEAHQDFRTVGFMNSFTSVFDVPGALAGAALHTWSGCGYIGNRARTDWSLRALWLALRAKNAKFAPAEVSGPQFSGPCAQVWRMAYCFIIGPFLTYFDRFVIGTLLTVSAVTFLRWFPTT